ncbi:MAG TPA: TadE/TadG family type IV pilus assembly protein [Pseudoxanthomonas sp.]|nr:TadE/TadG family type IV pilus assembly protein [Pseudoxanthomonas sp.]
MIALLRRLGRAKEGVTLVEFALILPALLLLLFGTLELGWRIYASSVVQGALHEAARRATVGDLTNTQIDAIVRQRLAQFSHAATIVTSTKSYDDFSQVATPERITSDTAPVGQFNVGDCYEDFNNNSQYDLDRGRTGLGNADDIVRYQVTLSYPRLFPFAGLAGLSTTETITSETVLRNQPYAGRSVPTPAVRCTAP